MGINRLAWRTLAARPVRTFLTMLGVALGVGVLSASLTLGAGLNAAIDRTVRDVVGSADLRVSAFLERGLSDATVDAIRGTAGVDIIAPTVERRTFLVQVPGTTPGGAVTIVGIDPGPYGQLHPFDLVTGALLIRPDEPSAIISETLAEADGYGIGSELTVQGVGAPAHLRVIGIAAGPGPVAGAAGRTVFVPVQTARDIFGLAGVSRVDIGLGDGTSAAIAADRLADRLTTEPYVLSSPADLAAGLRASTADFQATLAMLAAIVLFVGSFLIVNTLSMTVSERAREVGLLRAAGATRRQVVRFVLAGAAAIGIVGSAIGLAAGAALGLIMAGSIRALTGFAPEVEGLSAGSLVLAFSVGLGITVAAAGRGAPGTPGPSRGPPRTPGMAGPRLRCRGRPGPDCLAAGGGHGRCGPGTRGLWRPAGGNARGTVPSATPGANPRSPVGRRAAPRGAARSRVACP